MSNVLYTNSRLGDTGLQHAIKELAKKYSEEFINVRHHLHAHPELSYKELKHPNLFIKN